MEDYKVSILGIYFRKIQFVLYGYRLEVNISGKLLNFLPIRLKGIFISYVHLAIFYIIYRIYNIKIFHMALLNFESFLKESILLKESLNVGDAYLIGDSCSILMAATKELKNNVTILEDLAVGGIGTQKFSKLLSKLLEISACELLLPMVHESLHKFALSTTQVTHSFIE